MCHVHFFGMLLLCVDDEGCHGVWPVDVLHVTYWR